MVKVHAEELRSPSWLSICNPALEGDGDRWTPVVLLVSQPGFDEEFRVH